MTVSGSQGGGQVPNVGGGDNAPTPRPPAPAMLLAHVDAGGALFAAAVPAFANIAATDIGDATSSLSPFDSLVAGPVGAIDADIQALGDLDSILSQIVFTAGDFAASFFAPVDTSIAQALSDAGAFFAS